MRNHVFDTTTEQLLSGFPCLLEVRFSFDVNGSDLCPLEGHILASPPFHINAFTFNHTDP